MKKQRKNARKSPPRFRSEDEEREFWATHDSTDYFDYGSAREVIFPKLRPSTATISLRLPQGLLDDLRVLANQRDVPYQSLLKVYLSERVAEERRAKSRRRQRASA
jgi:predicted DNA binding CopG/RHH family protein